MGKRLAPTQGGRKAQRHIVAGALCESESARKARKFNKRRVSVHSVCCTHNPSLSHRSFVRSLPSCMACYANRHRRKRRTEKEREPATLYACARALASYSPQKCTYRNLYTHYTVTIPSLHCVYTVECTTMVNSRAQCAISRPESELLHG